MPLRFILGRAGSGKTYYCLSEMARLLREKWEGPLLFLLPEQATFIHERMLACEFTPHGYAGAEVTSFNRLIGQAARRAGGVIKPPLSEAGRVLLMGGLLTARRGELQVFGAGTLGGGFAKELVSLAEELMVYGVEPARLLEISRQRVAERPADPLAAKLADIALLCGDYAAAMAEYDNFADGLDFLAREIAENGFLSGAAVFVDGYISFTPRERAVLEALMTKAARLEIALALDPTELQRNLTEQDIFYPSWKTYGQLNQMTEAGGQRTEDCRGEVPSPPVTKAFGHGSPTLQAKNYPLPNIDTPHSKLKTQNSKLGLRSSPPGRFAANAELAFLERNCYPWNKQAVWNDPPTAIRVMPAANPREELAAAGREIQRLVREEGLRYRDISVIARETAPYEDLLPGVFGDLGIPYFVDSPKPLLYHPVVELTRSALEIWAGQAHYRHVFRYLKTGLTPLTAAETDVLENYCLAHGVKYFSKQRTDDLPPSLARGVAEGRGESTHDLINDIRQRGTAALDAFLQAAPAARDDVDGGSLLLSVLDLLRQMEVEQTLADWQKQAEAAGRAAEAAVHRQAYAKLHSFLSEASAMLAGRLFSAQQLLAMIDAGCAALTLSLIPPGLDQVLVASLERSRNPELRAAIVLGVNADRLPKKVQPEALLADHERNELQRAGLELAPATQARQMAEHYLAYIALTRSGERLMLTYALSGGDGRALLPSPLLKRLRAIFPQLTEERYGEARGPAELIGGAATLSVLARRLAAVREGQPVDGFWQDVYNWYAQDEQWRGPLQRLLQGLSHAPGQTRLSAPTLSRLYGGNLKSSVSQLEKFRACPFAYFAAYGLKLKPRPVYEITPLERGEIFHQALAHIGRSMSRGQRTEDRGQISEDGGQLLEEGGGYSWQALDEELATALVDEALRELTPTFLSGILTATARYRYLAARIRGTLIATVLLLAEHMRRGHFVPVAYELPFGSREEDALPALIIELDDGKKLEINGRIDRVDMARGENMAYFRIVDYKTGDTSLRLEDIFNGLRLQLLVYLQVVLDNSAYFQQNEAAPAGMYYMLVRDEYTSGPMPPEQEKAMPVGLKLKGLSIKDEQAVRLADPDISGYSRLIPVALSAKGFYSSSPGLYTEQFASLQEYLPRLLRDTAAQMLSGLAAAQPYRSATLDACTYCDYHNVCGFDRAIND